MAGENCCFNYATPHNIVNAHSSHRVHNHRLIDDNKNKD